MSNLKLDMLRKSSKAFVSESDYQVILLQYRDYLIDEGKSDSEKSAKEFCDIWSEYAEASGLIGTTTDGNIRYFCLDVADEEMTTEEFLIKKDEKSYRWENKCRNYWNIFKDLINKDSFDKKQIEAILIKDQTISYEQIHQLVSLVENRCMELMEKDFGKRINM